MSSVFFVLHECEINKHITSACAKLIICTPQTGILCKHHEKLEGIIYLGNFNLKEWVGG